MSNPLQPVCQIYRAPFRTSCLHAQNKRIHLRRVWVNDTVVERLKTRRSKAPVPLADALAQALLDWKAETMYGEAGDWVFASTKNKGRTPRSGSILTSDYLRPAAIRAGLELTESQRFGFHNLRHSLATFLVNQGVDVKTVQGILRHANVNTTLGLYAKSVDKSMLAAQEAVLRAMKPASKVVS